MIKNQTKMYCYHIDFFEKKSASWQTNKWQQQWKSDLYTKTVSFSKMKQIANNYKVKKAVGIRCTLLLYTWIITLLIKNQTKNKTNFALKKSWKMESPSAGPGGVQRISCSLPKILLGLLGSPDGARAPPAGPQDDFWTNLEQISWCFHICCINYASIL